MSIRIGIGLDVFGAGIDANAQTIYNRIIADGGVSNLSRLNFFVKGLKAIYGDLANVPVCYDAHWIGYKLGSGTGATAGQAAAKLYSLTVAGDAVQATAASQPLLLAHNGDNYWFGSGVSGNYCSTPNTSANQITGDIEIIAYANFVLGANMEVVSKWRTGTSGFILLVQTGGFIEFYVKLAASTIDVVSTVAITAGVKYIKATRNSITGDIKFYTSIDGITFTQLGTTISTTSGAISGSTSDVIIGGYTASNFQGKIYRATISNTIGGSPVVDFNPSQYNASTSQTAWTSNTGEVWTINTGTATTGYKGVLVDRTIVQGDGVDDGLLTVGNILSAMPFTMYDAFRGYTNNGGTGKANFGQFNIDGAIGRNDSVSIFLWGGAGGTIYLTDTSNSNKINMVTALRKLGINSTSIQINQNIIKTTAISAPFVAAKIFVFTNSYGSDNSTFQTSIISSIEDDTTTRTAMYNFIRSLNNNAF